jgi:hypothetical protein
MTPPTYVDRRASMEKGAGGIRCPALACRRVLEAGEVLAVTAADPALHARYDRMLLLTMLRQVSTVTWRAHGLGPLWQRRSEGIVGSRRGALTGSSPGSCTPHHHRRRGNWVRRAFISRRELLGVVCRQDPDFCWCARPGGCGSGAIVEGGAVRLTTCQAAAPLRSGASLHLFYILLPSDHVVLRSRHHHQPLWTYTFCVQHRVIWLEIRAPPGITPCSHRIMAILAYPLVLPKGVCPA